MRDEKTEKSFKYWTRIFSVNNGTRKSYHSSYQLPGAPHVSTPCRSLKQCSRMNSSWARRPRGWESLFLVSQASAQNYQGSGTRHSAA